MALSGHLLMNFSAIDMTESMPEMREVLEERWPKELERLREADPDLKQFDMAAPPDYEGSPQDRMRAAKWNWALPDRRRGWPWDSCR